VNRLVCAIIRAARVTGEASVFRNNGEEIWAQLAGSMTGLLAGLWAEGALNGASAEEAFDVRCDRSTMTEADIDGGRVICSVSFTAAAPIVQITVVLAMDDSGHLSFASRQTLARQQSQAA
jgi:phage tail sheath protein FI